LKSQATLTLTFACFALHWQVCDDAGKFDAAELADHAQRVMQAELDDMYAAVDADAAAKKES
jgi:hypothetical protein